MANSLRDQLLKAGLVTQAQIEQANQPKPKPADKPANKGKPAPKRPAQTPAPAPRQAKPAPVRSDKTASDLAQFYKERDQLERNERAEIERLAREAAARKKQTREQVRTLLSENLLNIDDADIRYNFVVGENIKYVYVTTQQQEDLAAGKLAITFMEGKRCIISADVAQQVLAIDPSKIMIINRAEDPTAD